MPIAVLQFFSGSIVETPPDLAPSTQYWANHGGFVLTDDGTLPPTVTINLLRIRTCAGRFQTSRTLPLDFAPLVVPPGTTPPLGLGWTSGSGSPYYETSGPGVEGIVCGENTGLYPARATLDAPVEPTLNPATGLRYTRAELFSYEFGWQIGSANLNLFSTVTVEEFQITEGSVEVTYEAGLPPNGSVPCCGTKPDTPLGPNPGETPTYPPLQPWDRECEGGGIVPTDVDVVDLEEWSL